MIKRVAIVGTAALLLSASACKKEKAKPKAEPAKPDTAAGKTTDSTKPAADMPKLDTGDDKVAFYRGCMDALNAKDWDKFGKCWAEDAEMDHRDSGMRVAKGPAQIIEDTKIFTDAFPDLKITPMVILQNGDK